MDYGQERSLSAVDSKADGESNVTESDGSDDSDTD